MLVLVDTDMFTFHAKSNHVRYLINKAVSATEAEIEDPADGHVTIHREGNELILRHTYGTYRGILRLRRDLDGEYSLTIHAALHRYAGRLLYELMAIVDIIG